MSTEGLRTNSIVFRVSREMLLAEGHVEPTPEEAAEMAAASRRHWEAATTSWAVYEAARPLLDAITDPVARAILHLHRSATIEAPTCQGCDMDGSDAEQPGWPCRTVETIAGIYGIDLPPSWHLWRRPDPEFSWSPPKPFVMPELTGFTRAFDHAILDGDQR